MAVLSMLTEAPMHAYRMQQLIVERHKDEVINVSQRNSVYQTIQRLLRDGLIAVESTERTENRPERTTYRITEPGRSILHRWLRAMLAAPAKDYPEFPAALAFLPTISVAEAVDALEERVTRLEAALAAVRQELADGRTFLPPVFLVESDYQESLITAELDYVRSLVQDLRSERITWPDRPDQSEVGSEAPSADKSSASTIR
jgi:DNA-binding PadR family transcriptional regulator